MSIAENSIINSESEYLVFIDETGDPKIHDSLEKYNHPTVYPVTTTAAIIINKNKYINVILPRILKLKQKLFNRSDMHFHSSEIRRKDGIFKIFLNIDTYEYFKKEIISIIIDSEIIIVSSSVNKINLLNNNLNRKNIPADLYMHNLEFIIDRVFNILNINKVTYVFETQGKKETKKIKEYMGNKVSLFFTKFDNIAGLELIDYIVYPYAKHCKDLNDINNDLYKILMSIPTSNIKNIKEWP